MPSEQTPPGKQTLAYGQWAAGMHPTGMHSCFGHSFNMYIRFPFFPIGLCRVFPVFYHLIRRINWNIAKCKNYTTRFKCGHLIAPKSAKINIYHMGTQWPYSHLLWTCSNLFASGPPPPNLCWHLVMKHVRMAETGGTLSCFYRPQTKITTVMFLHLSVSHSVQGGGVCIQGSLHRGGVGRPPLHRILWDTVNERAVRILLECILALYLLLVSRKCLCKWVTCFKYCVKKHYLRQFFFHHRYYFVTSIKTRTFF